MLSAMLAEPPRDAHPAAAWSDVLALFGLPSPLHPPTIVVGGWSHGVWKVETPDGVYAIKEMTQQPGDWWIEQLESAMAFELAAWRSGRITMAEPIPVVGSGQLLGRLETSMLGRSRGYRCHRWLDGEPSAGVVPDAERSRQVGTIVADLARLGIHTGTTADQLPWNAIDAFEETVEEAGEKGMDWANSLGGLRPLVTTLREEFVALAARAVSTAVMHRDFDPKNTLVQVDRKIALLDWDYAGPRLVASELLDAALSFAGGPVGADEACVLAAVEAYLDAGGPPLIWSDAAPPLVEEGFRWIMLNAWRCLGHRGVSPEQQSFAGSLLRGLISEWPESVRATRAWAVRLATADL